MILPVKTEQEVYQQFEKDISKHVLTVKMDGTDNHRHLRFKQPETGAFWFDIVTWPSHLVIQGDMGCYVFSRVENMLSFFRQPMTDESLSINPSYWGEKLQANSGYMKFSPKMFEERVIEWCEEQELTVANHKKLRDAIDEDVLGWVCEEGYESLYERFSRFSCDEVGIEGPDDLWDWGNFTDYEYHYLWCLWAIVWGIREYDKWKAQSNQHHIREVAEATA